MKAIILSLLVLFSAQSLHAKTLIVSDVDDTIKMTGVLDNKLKVSFNGIFRTKAFSGMSELYNELSSEDITFHYVSGSPKFIRSRVENFLDENNFPAGELTLKDKIKDDTFEYKTNTIQNLINEQKPDKVILIGDDTEVDPEIYDGLSQANPGLVEAIYIHSVKNRKLPDNASMKGYFSSVEIAAAEIVKGNLKIASLKKIVHSFVNQSYRSGIALKNHYCPREGREEIQELKEKITDELGLALLDKAQEKIISSCN